jgi:CubicO group peptidase (beta-lactamase class C family)
MRPRRGALVVVGLVLAVIAAMAADDGRFWVRYVSRIPDTFGWTKNKGPVPIPDGRAVIKGAAKPSALPACDPATLGPNVAPALVKADAWLGARNTDAFVVWHDGCLVHERYFHGDADTLRSVGPMAKVLVAFTAGRALKQGLIKSLDEPVADQIPIWKSDARSGITWRHMLGMHSGLQWYEQTKSPWGPFQRILLSGDYPRYAIALKSNTPPGRDYDYSAWTYDLLGIALQHASGKPYEQLASQMLWAPLGMSDAKIYVDRPGGTVHANCCLFTTARDWARLGAFAIAETNKPDQLPAGFMDALRVSHPDKPNYGLGVWLGSPYAPHRAIAGTKAGKPTPVKSQIAQSEPFAADDVLIFEGVEDTKAWVIASRGLVIVRMGGKAKGWDDAVVPNLVMRSLPHAADNGRKSGA